MPSKISPNGTCRTVQNNNDWICSGSGFGDCCMCKLFVTIMYYNLTFSEQGTTYG
jgi:hypothetical protein